MTDFELLRSYATSGCEEDFTVLVGRYANLVYSAALRQTGVPHDAEEISQTVFVILARKATTIREGTVLSGWLLRTTRFVAQNAQRREAHRRQTESEALSAYLNETDSAWKQIAPLLDEALVSLSDKDRNAVVLRFFEQKSFREIAHVLGTSEDTAQKRVSRALGRLRDLCVKRGVVTPSTIFGVAIATNAVQAAPSYLAASAISVATAGAAVAQNISAGVKATLAALERDRRRTLGLRIVKAGLIILVTLLTSYLFWPTMASRSPSGLGAARPGLPPPSPASLPPAGVAPIFAQTNLRQLRLRVIDFQSETPIPNARVTSKWGIMPSPRTNEAVTDIQGECDVSFDLTPREYWAVLIQIIKDGYVPKFVNWAEPRGDLIDDIPVEYTAKLARGQVIGGVVLNDSGDPVPEATVTLDGPGPMFDGDGSPEREGLAIAHSEVTDAQGRWLCNHVPVQMERINFNVLHPRYIAASFGVAKSQDTPNSPIIKLSEQDLRAQTAVMIVKRGLEVTGIVLDKAGKPIVNAKVTKDRAWRDPSANQATRSDGGFRFANGAKEELIITVQADGFVAQDTTAHLTTDTNELRFELSRAAALRGLVVDESEKPISKATVVARGGDFSNDRFEWYTLTDEQGKFAWLSVPPLHKRYDIYVDGFASPTNLELSANGVEQRITLRGSAKIPRFRISGNVVDAETRQAINAYEVWVALKIRYDINNTVVSLSPELRTTGTRGKFAFLTSKRVGGLAESYAVEIRADGYSAAKLIVPGQLTNDCQVNFTLKAAAGLTGIVQSPEGEPVGRAVVLICDKSEDFAYMKSPGELDLALSHGDRAETDTNGIFMIPAATGTGTVFIAHSLGYAKMPAAQLLSSPKQRLQPWGHVAGLLMVGSQPGTNETVYLGNVFPWNPTVPQVHLTATTDADGHFTLDGVPPGEWRISHELRRRGRQIRRIPLTQTFTIQARSGQVTQVMLGGTGRKVVGQLTANASGQRLELGACFLTLTSELPGLPFPRREQFASEAEYVAAKSEWPARKLEFQNSPAGIEAMGTSREYLALVEADRSFAIDDVIPGVYELKVEIEPGGTRELRTIRPDPVVINWLDGLNREVVVSATSGNEAAPVDLGILEPNPQKP